MRTCYRPRSIFLPETLAKMREMKAERERSPISFAASGSVVDLVKEAARSTKVKRFVLVDKSRPHN